MRIFVIRYTIDMKIIYIYSELVTKGGTDRVLTEKANYLAENGYDVTIVTESQMGRPPIFALSPRVKLLDIGIDFNRQYGHNILYRACLYLTYIQRYKRRLKRILMQQRPDIVVTTLGRSLDFLTSIHDGSIKIGEAHTTKEHLRNFHLLEQRGWLFRLLVKRWRKQQMKSIQKLQALVLLTRQDADDWAGTTRTCVIPNSLPFYPEERSTCEAKQAIMVGRYNDAKGYDYLIDAWAIVNRKHPDWKLNVYGSGEMHDDVRRWIDERGLQDTIIMNEPTDDIMHRYLESSLCVVSSVFEGFSMVLLEAMACGLPVVSFDCPWGPRNIIRDGEDGLLVDYLNTQALADTICRVIEDKELRLRLGSNAKKNIARYAKENVMKQWTDLFESLKKNRKPMGISKKIEDYVKSTKYNIGFIDGTLGDVIDGKPIRVNWVKHRYKDRWFADPFILDVTANDIIVLVEEWYDPIQRGRISKLTIDRQTFELKALKVMIEEDVHLSFHAIDRIDGEVYIHPEMCANGRLDSYHYIADEDRFEKVGTLCDVALTDSVCNEFFNGKKLMFSTCLPDANGKELGIYEWDKSACRYQLKEQVHFDENISRSAGNFFQLNGKTYRPSQVCIKSYGDAVSIQEVCQQNGQWTFNELRRIYSPHPDLDLGFHTFNEYKGLIVVDAVGYRHAKFCHLLRRLKHIFH